MAESRKAMYAALGTGSLAVERTKELGQRVLDYAKDSRRNAAKGYRNLVERGESITERIQRSAAVKRAGDQTRVAQSRVKGAATSIRKAVKANAEAAQSAAKKVG